MNHLNPFSFRCFLNALKQALFPRFYVLGLAATLRNARADQITAALDVSIPTTRILT